MEQSKITGAVGGAAQGASIGASFGPVGAVVGGVLGGIGGFLGGGGEDKAKKIAEKNAKIIERTRAFNRRQEQFQLEHDMGQIKANIYGSNILYSGSSKSYATQYQSRFKEQMKWSDAKAYLDADLAREGGQVAADQISRAGVTSMVQGLGSLAGSGLFSFQKSDPGLGASWAGNDPFKPR